MYRWVNHEKRRYYQAHLDQDLFGEWTLVTCWGVLGSRRNAGMRVQTVPSYEEGLGRLESIARRRRERGYVPLACGRERG